MAEGPEKDSDAGLARRSAARSPVHNLVAGRRTNKVKIQLAKDFRRAPTEAERVLWQASRKNQLDGLHFRRQHVIGGFIVDFYCNSAALIVEVDGSSHADRAESDTLRDAALTLLGLTILRVSNDDVL